MDEIDSHGTAVLLLSVLFLVGIAFAGVGTVAAQENPGNDEVVVLDTEDEPVEDSPFDDIQTAVNNSDAGYTVKVGSGTYEEQVVVNKSLSLITEEGATILSPTDKNAYEIPENDNIREPVLFAYGGDESNGEVSGSEVISVDVTGFTVDGNDVDPGAGDEVSTGILFRNVNGDIRDNEVRNMHEGGGETFGIVVYGNSSVEVVGNDVEGYERGGIGIQGDLDEGFPDPSALVKDNTVNGPGEPVGGWGANGIQIAWGATGEAVNNTVTGHLHESGEPGGILAVGSEDVVVRDNTLRDNVDGVQVFGDAFFGTDLEAVNTTVRNNTVENSSNAGVTVGPESVDTEVTENDIRDNEIGLEIWGDADEIEGLNFSYNNVVGNEVGVENFFDYVVDASHNWWGDATGPDGEGSGDGDSVDEDVEFTPWLTAPVEDDPDTAEGDTEEVEVVPETDVIEEGGETTVTVILVFDTGVEENRTDEADFESSSPNVADIDDNGTVTAGRAGDATITATVEENGEELTGDAEITVFIDCVDRRSLNRGQEEEECPHDRDLRRGETREELDERTGGSGRGEHRDSTTERRNRGR